MLSTLSFEINSPAVAGEILDGEAIILHLPRGHYFSSEGSGAVIWAGVERRMTVLDIATALVDRFGVAADDARAAVELFLEELIRQELIRPSSGSNAGPEPSDPLPGAGAYSAPRLEIYTDMQNLLLLDPIHDVDATGWPVAPDRAVA